MFNFLAHSMQGDENLPNEKNHFSNIEGGFCEEIDRNLGRVIKCLHKQDHTPL